MRRGLPACAGPISGTLAGALTALFVSLVGGNPVQTVALPLAIALLFFVILDPRKVLIAILAVRSACDLFLDSTRFSVGGYSLGAGGVINAFVILIVLLLAMEKPGALPKRDLGAWAALLVLTLASAAFAPVTADAVRIYLALLSYCAVFVSAFFIVRSPGDFRTCVRIVLWSSAIPAVYALVELATGGAHRPDGLRLQSTFSHPNIFAFYLVLIVCLVLYVLKSATGTLKAGTRIALGLYMLLLLALLVLTQSRSAWIACGAVFALYGFAFERRYLAYLMLVPLLALLVPSVHERLLDLGTGNEYEQYARLNSLAWRRLMWETSLQWMRPDHYLLGYGLGSFTHYSPQFFPLAGDFNPGAHSVYVQLLFEVGAAGLLAYLWLYARLIWVLRAVARFDRLAAFISIALVVAYLIVSFSDNMLAYLSFNWYFWFITGAASAAVMAGRKTPSAAQESVPGTERAGPVPAAPVAP